VFENRGTNRIAAAQVLMHSDLEHPLGKNARLFLMDTLATALNSLSAAPTAKHRLRCSVHSGGKARPSSSLNTPLSVASGADGIAGSLCPLSWRLGTGLQTADLHHTSRVVFC
jgi:hypothetical protein